MKNHAGILALAVLVACASPPQSSAPPRPSPDRDAVLSAAGGDPARAEMVRAAGGEPNRVEMVRTAGGTP